MFAKYQMRGKQLILVIAAYAMTTAPAVGGTLEEIRTTYGLKIDTRQISVSGISSGADIAHQIHIAYSGTIIGAGLLAASPYYCAKGDVSRATQVCSATQPPFRGPPDVDELIQLTRAEFQQQQIDDPANLSEDRVYLFSGSNDHLVPTTVVDQLYEYYTEMGVPDANIEYVKDVPAEHAMVTDNFGSACEFFGTPYVNNCGSEASAPGKADTAGELLQQIYGELVAPAGGAGQGGMLLEFSQSDFIDDPAQYSMDQIGRIYVPSACQDGETCKLHVAFHGCEQNDDLVGSAFYENAGYNDWAEANNIIVLYPQVQASNISPFNPMGCWDWWGQNYTGADYHRQTGPQVAAIKSMIDCLGETGSCKNGGDPCAGWPAWLEWLCRWFS